MNCPSCGTENPDGSLFCKQCGRRLSETVTCPVCGELSPADGNFCIRCGARLTPLPATDETDDRLQEARTAVLTAAPAAPEPAPAEPEETPSEAEEAPAKEAEPQGWRQILMTVGDSLAIFTALASVIFLFCLGCDRYGSPAMPSVNGTNIYYYFGEVYRTLFDFPATETSAYPVPVYYAQAVAGTLISAGMVVCVGVLFILTLVRFLRSFTQKGKSVTAMAARTYFFYLAFALLFLALHAVRARSLSSDGTLLYRVSLNDVTIAGLAVGAVGIAAAAALNAAARMKKPAAGRILQLSFSGVCLLLVAAVFALLSGAIVQITLSDGQDTYTAWYGFLGLYEAAAMSGGTTYAPAVSDAVYAVYHANQMTAAVCSLLGFVFLIVLFLLLAVLASSLVKSIAEPAEKPKTLRYMIPAILFTVGLTICSALAASALAALSVGDGASGLTASTQFTPPIIAAVLSALTLILLIVYGALSGGKDENKE